ncbi:GyrI-like domain-containing protein [Corynebacterium halotolerans]|uniref:AraC effector-binding domain-containing protein n=1 Tax=Corynebacterium halotolerans YIM 70093 = DSM 44683 TaxID=1121362 RepID=M1NVK9_9CORY|nr:GyrI-like domain-containing protein [Corynebacterium halotolerans]AGF71525.1 hypothetical protein A605_02555 [Corynebacterium halotolerans YIM 70093 = DSM 44683]
MTDTPDPSYLHAEPRTAVEFLEITRVPTVVRKMTDHPMSDMAAVFDSTFTALFPLLEVEGIKPVGPAFSLHHRMPTETSTFEVGVPVDRLLAEAVTTDSGVVLESSSLPGGSIATVSHLGPYDDLGEAWDEFTGRVMDGGAAPQLPFWEVYVTEPGPGADPASMRTDLYTMVGD